MPTLSWNLQLHNDGSQRSDGVRSFPLDMFYSKVYAFDFFLKIFFLFFFSPIFFRKKNLIFLKIQISEKNRTFSTKNGGNFRSTFFPTNIFRRKKNRKIFFSKKNQKYSVWSKTYPKESSKIRFLRLACNSFFFLIKKNLRIWTEDIPLKPYVLITIIVRVKLGSHLNGQDPSRYTVWTTLCTNRHQHTIIFNFSQTSAVDFQRNTPQTLFLDYRQVLG